MVKLVDTVSFLRGRISQTFDNRTGTRFSLTDARAVRLVLDRLEQVERELQRSKARR